MEAGVWREVCEVGGFFGRWCGVVSWRKEAEEEEGGSLEFYVLFLLCTKLYITTEFYIWYEASIR